MQVLSPDSLSVVTDLLQGQDVLRLWLTGDSLLQTKLSNGGVTTLSFARPIDSSAALDISMFHRLSSFDLSFNTLYEDEADFALKLGQGSQLLHLSLPFQKSLLLVNNALAQGFLPKIRSLVVGNHLPILGGVTLLLAFAKLPHLESFKLSWPPQHFNPSCLPRTLTECCLRHIPSIDWQEEAEFGGLPPQLTSLELSFDGTPERPPTLPKRALPDSLTHFVYISDNYNAILTLKDIEGLPKSLRDLRFSWFEGPIRDLAPALPPSLAFLSLVVENSRISVPTAKLFPSTLTYCPFELKNGDVSKENIEGIPPAFIRSYCSQNRIPCTLLPGLPSSVRSVMASGPLQGLKLPIHLRSLDIRYMDDSFENAFPETLRELNVDLEDSIAPLKTLPASLKFLRLQSFSSGVLERPGAVDELFGSLPKGLTTFIYDYLVPLPGFSRAHLEMMPCKNLQTLTLKLVELQDMTIWSSAPTYIKRLSISTAARVKLDQNPVCEFESLRHLHSLQLEIGGPAEGFGDYLLTHLPPNIVELDYKVRAPEKDCISGSALMNLPRSLERLSMPPVDATDEEIRKFEHLPSGIRADGIALRDEWDHIRSSP